MPPSTTWEPMPPTSPMPPSTTWTMPPTSPMPPTPTDPPMPGNCWNAGERVRITRSSNFWGETYECADLTTSICEGDFWTEVEFRDGYTNWYRYEDFEICDCFLAGDQVRISPNSPYAGEHAGCAK